MIRVNLKICLAVIMIYLFSILCYSQDASKIFETCVKSVGYITDDDNGNGSGFFINKNTFITNYHITSQLNIKNAFIKLKDGNIVRIKKIIKENSKVDLSILETDNTNDYLLLANPDSVRAGEKVYAIGNPHATRQVYEFTITEGIVNNVKNEEIKVGGYGSKRFTISSLVILHSASLNPGNSGSPLLNRKGEVIGINSFYNPFGNNLFFAIHIKELIDLLNNNNIPYNNQTTGIPFDTTGKSGVTDINIKPDNKYKDTAGTIVKKTSEDKGIGTEMIILILFLFASALLFIYIISSRKKKLISQVLETNRTQQSNSEYYQIYGTGKMESEVAEESAEVIYNGIEYAIGKMGIIIGRDLNCNIIIDDKKISKFHCRIMREDGKYILLDLGSKNGTYINGYSIKRHILSNHDIIQIADKSIIFRE